MKTILILMLLLSFSGWADEEETTLEDLQKQTLEMVHEFQRNHYKYLKTKSPSISVRMVKSKELLFDDSVASCSRDPKVVVLVEKQAWKEASQEKREHTLFRQLGRCVLNRTHQDEEARGIPLSIMSRKTNTQNNFKKYREYYIKELFDKKTLPFMEKIINS